ncbi:MAG: hypothetical protein K2N43_02965 [Lachnospiraceae bacterium]|nr:hypothetical protein [Lachnospiraceae bacterium]
MSASARNYVYQVKIEKGKEKPVPTVSIGMLRQYQADIGKYLKQESKEPK